ncbi:hypothetical protein [Streptomyces alanosinicus]|nr:hypothetical protein [Streptomyces alanosinicus]
MTALLAGVGTRIAERWLQTVVLAGLLWVATLVVAVRLGHAHPFDTVRLTDWLDRIAAHRTGHSSAAILLVTAAALLAAGAVGLVADALGGLFQWLWGADGAGLPGSLLLRWRRNRWRRLRERDRRAVARAAARAGPGGWLVRARGHRAVRRRRAPEPQRPTRIGECFASVAVRLHARYRLDLEPAWPRLWALLPEPLRLDLAGARTAYDAAARLAGWGLLYAAVALLWWPAALVAAGVLALSVARARAAAAVLAALVEAAVDLHLTALGERLGVEAGEIGRLGSAIGHRLEPPNASP